MEDRFCGIVDRAVASDTRGPGFEASHWQLLNVPLSKRQNKKSEAGNAPLKMRIELENFKKHKREMLQ